MGEAVDSCVDVSHIGHAGYALFDGVRPCGLFEEAKWLVENQRVWGR